MAAAQPYTVISSETEVTEAINVIEDKSPSSQLIEYDEIELEDIELRTQNMGGNESYDLSENIISQLEPDEEYLIVSDMQSQDEQEIIQELNRRNITVNILETEIENTQSVNVQGPEQTYAGVENTYQVNIESTNNNYGEPEVVINQETINLEQTGPNTWSFEKVFEERETQEITASINNGEETHSKYYKTVDVGQKPDILFLDEPNSFATQIEEYFNVEYSENVPENIHDYEAVITTPNSEINEEVRNYVAEENGLLHIGETPADEQLLPIETLEPEEEPETFESERLSIVIDSSISTEGDGLREAQHIALNIIDALPETSEVGAITYKQESYELAPLRQLSENKEHLEESISRLESSGPTFHHTGIKGADEMLQGQGDIILITDGLLSVVNERRGVPEDTIEAANNTDRPITVVDQNTNVNPEFLQKIADLSDGNYISSDSDSMQFIFETRETEREGQSIWIKNENHFITQEARYTGYVQSYNTNSKSGSNSIIAADQNDYLSTWRYGLGRVATIADTEEDLSRLMSQEPAVALRTLTWAVGATQDEGETVATSASRPEHITIRSDEPMEDSRFVDGKYQREVTPNSTGIHQYEGQIAAYNYHKDLQTIGYNENIDDIAQETGGNIYDIESLQNNYEDLAVQETETTEDSMELSNYLIALSVVLFLTTLWIRKKNRMK